MARKHRVFRQEFRRQFDYDRDPPRCGNCTYLLPSARGNTASTTHGPYCNLGKFATVMVAVCDAWVGRRGEKLESPTE